MVRSQYALDDEILCFESADGRKRFPWTLRHACEGTQIMGESGSGKTSGSGSLLARFMLLFGFGGLVLTPKEEDCQWWKAYAAETGRTADLIIIEPRGKHRFNFLNYEHKNSKDSGLTRYNLVSLFRTATEGGRERESTTDPYWEDGVDQLLGNAIDVVLMAKDSISVPNLLQVVRSAPLRRSDSQSPSWRKESYCWRLLEQAQGRITDPERRRDLQETIDYFMLDFAGLADRTRSVIVSSFTSKATSLMHSPLRALFCSDDPDTVTPEDSHKGKVIVLNLPIKEFGEAGRFVQILFKTLWQRATERRVVAAKTPPVFLWADESQYFVTTHDVLFQQTARSKLAATVYLTQSISNYYAAMRSRNGNAAVDSLLGNLATKIFHANGDPVTNEWAERLFAKDFIHLRSSGMTSDSVVSRNVQESMLPSVPAKLFTTLRKGGPQNNRIVEAFVFQGGRKWTPQGSHFLLARFVQPEQ